MTVLTPLRNPLAIQHNNMVRTAWKMSIIEQRIFLQALSDLSIKTETFPVTEIPVAAVMRGLSNGESYHDVHDAVNRLITRTLDLVPTVKRSTRTEKVTVMSKVQFDSAEGIIRVKFNADAEPYLLGLSSEFTVTEIQPALNFKNPNAPHLYRILHSYAGKGSGDFHEETIDLDTLKMWLLESKELYPIFTEFKRRVIEPVFVDFERAGYKASWKASKTGKKTTGVTFRIPRRSSVPKLASPTGKPKPKNLPDFVPDDLEFQERIIKRLSDLKLTEQQIRTILNTLRSVEERKKLMTVTYQNWLNQRDKPAADEVVGASTVKLLKKSFSKLYPKQ